MVHRGSRHCCYGAAMAHTWVRQTEIAKHTNQSVSTIKRLTKSGGMPHVKMPRYTLYSIEAVDEWLLGRQQQAVGEAPRRRRRTVQPTTP